MDIVSARLNRFLIAAALGLLVAFAWALSTDQPPSAAVIRGDFPAFYTMATIANRGEGAALYDLESQRRIQNEVWPSLQGSVLPAAYPAFLAALIEPLGALSPPSARVVWTAAMVLCVVVAGIVIARASPRLHGVTWQVIVGALLFSPLFLGVLGGQIVGLSVLLYAALISLERRKGRGGEVLMGVVAGLWMYKPHFSLAIVATFFLRRQWLAVMTWLTTSVILWAIGVAVAGSEWLSHWYSFVQTFAHIDLSTNAAQMTGVVPSLYVLCGWLGCSASSRAEVWEMVTILSSLVVPCALALAVWRPILPRDRGLIVVVGPLLVLFAPAVNFYDIALAALPLLTLLRPDRRSDLVIAGVIVALSQGVMLVKDTGTAGLCFAFATLLAALFVKAASRERAEVVRRE
jgi:hypothetical protein